MRTLLARMGERVNNAGAEPPLLIEGKSVAPGRPPGHLARPRLEALLGEATAGKLTLVTGPAGSGKTALLAAWASGRPRVAWLTLDEFDNDPAALLAYLIAALSGASGSEAPTFAGSGLITGLITGLTGWLSR